VRTVVVARVACVVLLPLHPMAAHAQIPPAQTFEVSSVKPNTQTDGPGRIIVDPGRFTATGALLSDLVRYAWGYNSLTSQTQVVGGPSWMATTRFDIVATTNGMPSLTMLKALLENRFKVVAHVESRAAPVFALSVDRADTRLGPAIQRSTSQCVGPGGTAPPSSVVSNLCSIRGGPGMYTAEGVSMAQLARLLGNFPAVGRAVIDRTELQGVYDWTLQWTPAFTSTAGGGASTGSDTGTAVSLFTALREQLGLKLEARRAPIEMLVIDHAELPASD
jgi:uncharacterized protein (TIGR03435 family)